LGSTEIGVAWVTGKCWFKVPETIRIELSGQTQPGVYAKDVMIYIAGCWAWMAAPTARWNSAEAYIDQLPMHERIIFPNMSTEIGAKCGLIAADQVTLDSSKTRPPPKARDRSNKSAPSIPRYERVLELDVSKLGPQVACHPDVDNVKPLEEVEGLEVQEVYIGTCTNARYEDLEIVANILKGRKVDPYTRVIVTPASERIYKKAMQNGLIEILLDAGCTVTGSGCGACIGRHGGILAPGERALTTMNRNFIGRMGSPLSEIYLASPATAAYTALTGKITDPRHALEDLKV
jgi:3-isopropylmalate/(R)-2-methylmalate dehydratase large subunit